MSISPPSDIVLDVVNAADPANVLQAKQRLAAVSGSASRSAQVEAFQPANNPFANPQLATKMETEPSHDVRVKFEGMVLQTFIESILPENAESTYGSGLAGDMWKSMLSEKIAHVVAERGGLGIANRILADYVVTGDSRQSIAGTSDVELLVEKSHAIDHAAALIHDKQRKFVELLSGWQLENNGEDVRS